MTESRKVPKLRFPEFSGDWEQRKLKEHCEMFNGDRSSKYPKDSDMVSEGIPFINAGDLENGTVNLRSAKHISKEKYNQLGGAKLREGDIVYCLRGTIGKNAIISNFDEGTVASSLVAIRPKNIDGRYLFYILNSDIEYRQRIVRNEGAAQPNLSAKSVSDFVIPLPNLKEQCKISSYFMSVDAIITLHQRKLESLKKVKKSFLQKMFPKNGEKIPEIRFPEFSGDWEQRKLGELGKCQSGVGFPSIEQGGKEGIPFFKVSDMNLEGNQFELSTANNYVSYEQIQKKGWKPITSLPAIFFAKVGAAVMLNRKRLCRKPFLLDNNTMAYILGPELNVEFSKQLFEIIYLPSLAQEGALPSYNASNVENLNVVITQNENEQHKIGAFLQKIDKTITLHQRKLEVLNKLKKAMLQNMFV